MNKAIKTALAAILILTAVAIADFNFRAFLPYPGSYVGRMMYLKGWSSNGYYAFNCSGFLSNAHGSDFLNEREMYAGANGQMILVAEFANRSAVDENKLQPGDVAAFQGPSGFQGLHVAGFVRPGVWIDGDSRRGNVDTYRLQDKSNSDEWFQGKVRIMRWATPARAARLDIHFFAKEQAALLAE
jgi:hypothetical protein